MSPSRASTAASMASDCEVRMRRNAKFHPDVCLCGCFSKLFTSQKSRTLQSRTVYFSRVSYLFGCNANDTYVLRMSHVFANGVGRRSSFTLLPLWLLHIFVTLTLLWSFIESSRTELYDVVVDVTSFSALDLVELELSSFPEMTGKTCIFCLRK